MLLAILQSFRARLAHARDPEAAFSALSATAREIGFEACVYFALPEDDGSTGRPEPRAVQSSLESRDMEPDALAHYLACGSARKRAIQTMFPIAWSVAALRKAAAPEDGPLLGALAPLGVIRGVTAPAYGRDGDPGVLTLLRCGALPAVSDTPAALLPLCLQLATLYHAGASGRAAQAAATEGEVLAPRELECLRRVASGRTSVEAARLIGISEHTVNFHLRNAARRLGAVNRIHAVARAATLGLLGSPQEKAG